MSPSNWFQKRIQSTWVPLNFVIGSGFLLGFTRFFKFRFLLQFKFKFCFIKLSRSHSLLVSVRSTICPASRLRHHKSRAVALWCLSSPLFDFFTLFFLQYFLLLYFHFELMNFLYCSRDCSFLPFDGTVMFFLSTTLFVPSCVTKTR